MTDPSNVEPRSSVGAPAENEAAPERCSGAIGSAWLPIETAPKDGTIIDLWIGGEFAGRRPDCFWGKPDHECGEAGEYCDSDWHSEPPSWVDSTFQEFLNETPTHWMAEPAPPNGRDEPRP